MTITLRNIYPLSEFQRGAKDFLEKLRAIKEPIILTVNGNLINTTIDNFTKQLHDNLEAVEERAKSLRESVQSAPKKTQAEIQSKLDEAKARLEAKKQEFDEYRAKLKTQFEEKESEVKSHVDEWKATRKVKKLEHRADKAEVLTAQNLNGVMMAVSVTDAAGTKTLIKLQNT